MEATKENNRLIAEFMGAKEDGGWTRGKDGVMATLYSVETPHGETRYYDRITCNGIWDVTVLKYHESWDWLMPVVEKIEGLSFDTHIDNTRCYISYGTPQGDGCKFFKVLADIDDSVSKIDAVYQAVIQFIKWYNSEVKLKQEEEG